MKKLLSLILSLTLTLTLFASCASASKALASTYLNLGEKYLTDLNYEQAIVYFNKLIEVEPKNTRAYTGAAEAYAAMGDTASAIAILEQGIEAVDDPTELEATLTVLLAELVVEDEPAPDEPVTDEETTPEAEDEAEEEEEEEDLLYLYDDILEELYTAISECWSFEEYEAAGLNDIYCEDEFELSDVGYAYMDLNGDGVMELLIGECSPYRQGYFIDLYTIVDGQVTRVAYSGMRSFCHLCEGGKIYIKSSSGAENSYFEYYSVASTGKLSFIEAVVYDGWYDADNPYFYCVTGTEYSSGNMSFSEENYIPITQEAASEIMDSYITVEIAYTSFSSLH